MGWDEAGEDRGGDDAARGAEGGGAELEAGGVCACNGVGEAGLRAGDGDGVEGGAGRGEGAGGKDLEKEVRCEEGGSP